MLTNANSRLLHGQVPDQHAEDRIPGNRSSRILTDLRSSPTCRSVTLPSASSPPGRWLLRCTVLNFAEAIETVQLNLRRGAADSLLRRTPYLGTDPCRSHIKLSDASWFKRQVAKVGMGLANYIGKARVANGGDHTTASRLAYYIGNPLFFRALKERIGLRRARWTASGAAPIAPEVLQFFMGLGVPVYELYGMTENVAVATVNFDGRVKLGTVGEPYPDIGFRLADGPTRSRPSMPASSRATGTNQNKPRRHSPMTAG